MGGLSKENWPLCVVKSMICPGRPQKIAVEAFVDNGPPLVLLRQQQWGPNGLGLPLVTIIGNDPKKEEASCCEEDRRGIHHSIIRQ